MKNINKAGFTIIEVVLVLAIAGLIFLMVFIALPNMQTAQRNSQRRNDYNNLSTQVTDYAVNHNGVYPNKISSLWMNYKGTDPDGNPYTETDITEDIPSASAIQRNNNQVYIIKKATCANGNPTSIDARVKDFVVYGYMEDGHNTHGTYCLQSHL